jgi:monoamine oxidase
MSHLTFNSSLLPTNSKQNDKGGVRTAFSNWLLTHHGASLKEELAKQRSRKNADYFKQKIASANATKTTDIPIVGIVGGGFAGLYAGLILQSLGIEFEIFEASDRVGGRIHTWYSSDYSDKNSGLYGELGGMRLPQFSEDMLPVQQLALAVNSVLERNGLDEKIVKWRKFYYNSEVQRMRYNNMPLPINAVNSSLNTLNFDAKNGGDIPDVWFVEKKDSNGNKYLPINQIFGKVIGQFVGELSNSFAAGFNSLMQYDQYSMWAYLTTVFTLGDLEEYYDPSLGGKSDLLPWFVASFLETTNVGTNMDLVSFVEMVIAVYDWGGSIDPYLNPPDNYPFTQVYMLTADKGMQHFPDACEAVLNLSDAVSEDDGTTAQKQIGMLKVTINGKEQYNYNPPNLTEDAKPPHNSGATTDSKTSAKAVSKNAKAKQRVFRNHKVLELKHDPTLFKGHGGMKVKINNASKTIEKQYPYVISTLPFGQYLNGALKENLLNDLSFTKAQAIRECNYMSSFKAFLTFKTQFWAILGERQDKGLGAAATDRPNRQIIYPSYGYPENGKGPKQGVLQVYCWAEDATRLGALSDEERINECLKGISFLYPEVDIYKEFAGYNDGKTTKTWFWDQAAGGGAFALFTPEQFKNIYPVLLTPEFNGCLNIAGEACSVHHGWIVGALDSAYNSVYNILQQAGATEKIKQMQATWGSFSTPDVAASETANVMEYTFSYNQVDRNAAAIAPKNKKSIYGNSTYIFNGTIPAFIENYATVPPNMMMTNLDNQVLEMLNDSWNDNIEQRNKVQPKPIGKSIVKPGETAVKALERIYYGNNFMTIPKPLFWLKDDDEFARQQTGGFMPDYLTKVTPKQLNELLNKAKISNPKALGALDQITYVADFRKYVEACTVIPEGYYLAKPIIFFKVTANNELMPVGIQLDVNGEVFTPTMKNAENAWLLAKMQTNCAGQSLHDVVSHQLLTHQICAMVSISVFSEEIFPSQDHPVFKLLRPHVVKTVEFMQEIYNRDYNPYAASFPETRTVNGKPGVYQLGFVYDLIFSCGRIGNYQLQDKVYNNPDFKFLDLAMPIDSKKRGVEKTPFSYPYVHDGMLWYKAMSKFVNEFVDSVYTNDKAVANDKQLQNFFKKLTPAFNHIEGSKQKAKRFPEEVKTTALLKEVLTMFIWQFSVQHTVVNDGAYNMAAFVPNASTLMYPMPITTADKWTAQDVINCLPDTSVTYPDLGNMNFLDIQVNASVTGQGPYPETVFGRGVLEPSIDFLQDLYSFADPKLRAAVDNYYQEARKVGTAIQQRQWKDTAKYQSLHPDSENVPETVVFDLISPINVMTSILT